MYSVKFNGPGYKYEIGISIQNCDIVRLNGPFKAGKADSTIFHEHGTKDALCDTPKQGLHRLRLRHNCAPRTLYFYIGNLQHTNFQCRPSSIRLSTYNFRSL